MRPNRFLLIATSSAMSVAVLGCQPVVDYLRGLHAYTVPSTSMEKTILQGETFLCDLNAYKSKQPSRGDVIIFRHSNNTDQQDLVLVKRLIGLPGDTIEGKNGVVFRNGAALDEPYAEHIGPTEHNLDTFGPVTTAPGEVFVMGDNRDNSLDSRMPDEFGTVKVSDIQGKALSILKSDHVRKGQLIR